MSLSPNPPPAAAREFLHPQPGLFNPYSAEPQGNLTTDSRISADAGIIRGENPEQVRSPAGLETKRLPRIDNPCSFVNPWFQPRFWSSIGMRHGADSTDQGKWRCIHRTGFGTEGRALFPALPVSIPLPRIPVIRATRGLSRVHSESGPAPAHPQAQEHQAGGRQGTG